MKKQTLKLVQVVLVVIGFAIVGLDMFGIRYELSPSFHSGELGIVIGVIGLFAAPIEERGRTITSEELERIRAASNWPSNNSRTGAQVSATSDRVISTDTSHEG